MIPIRAKGSKRSKKPQDRSIPTHEEMLERLKELHAELRCVEKAILSLERLAITRCTTRQSKAANWDYPEIAGAKTYKRRIQVFSPRNAKEPFGEPKVAATS